MASGIIPSSEPYDALVIGSGATGGVAAKQLCEAGLRTMVLEAGRSFADQCRYGSRETNLLRALYQHFLGKHQLVQERHPIYWEADPRLLVDDRHNPYTTPKDKPYRWIRAQQVGGRSLLWGGITLRMSDHEFKAARRDGIGVDWPISHADLNSHYGMIERFLCVHGCRDGLPQLPDGEFADPSPLSPGERCVKDAVEAGFADRKVIVARGINADRRPPQGKGYSRLSSPGTTLAAAAMTGKLRLLSSVAASRILIDPNTGKASGVEYIDRSTRETKAVRARIIFLCASTIESLRILLNSRSNTHPHGIGGSSGLLGKFLMDHIGGVIYFYLPNICDDGRQRYTLRGSDGIIIPRYQNLGAGQAPYLRGFGLWGAVQRLPFPPIMYRKRNVAIGFLCFVGEPLPHAENHMRLDDTVVDNWGISVPHISCAWTANDVAVAKAAKADAEDMIAAAGGIVAPFSELVRIPFIERFIGDVWREWAVTTPGLFVHEVGGARMGHDAKSSVVNQFCQIWEVRNIFVTDGACWPSTGWQNPTLTEMAITARACAYAVEQLKRGGL
jgi:choline dehydrogenase-like flavoprotein